VFPRSSHHRRRRRRRRRRLRSGPFSQHHNLLSTTPAQRSIFISYIARVDGPRGGEPVVRKFLKKKFLFENFTIPRRLRDP